MGIIWIGQPFSTPYRVLRNFYPRHEAGQVFALLPGIVYGVRVGVASYPPVVPIPSRGDRG